MGNRLRSGEGDERTHDVDQPLWLLDGWNVAAVGDRLEPRTTNGLGELRHLARRRRTVLLADDADRGDRVPGRLGREISLAQRHAGSDVAVHRLPHQHVAIAGKLRARPAE